jgi:endonuclease IV
LKSFINAVDESNITVRESKVDERVNRYEDKWKTMILFHSKLCVTYYKLIHNSINKFNSTSVQVYHDSSSYKSNKSLDKNDIMKMQNLVRDYNFKLFTHSSNMLNIASKPNRDKVLMRLKKDVALVDLLKGSTVVHLGSGNVEDTNKTLSMIDTSGCMTKYPILIENSAYIRGKRSFRVNCETIAGIEHVGVCLDTQYMFAHREYNLSKSENVDRLFSDFDETIGIKKLRLIYLNDSKVVCKCGADKHEFIGYGYI